jgi:hypothetical protein
LASWFFFSAESLLADISVVQMFTRAVRYATYEILPIGWLAASLALILWLLPRRRRELERVFLLTCGALLASRTVLRIWDGILPWDFRVFYRAGVATWAGRDLYQDPLMLSPPSALPLFAAFALRPISASAALWSGFNLSAAICLGPIARRLVRVGADTAPGASPHREGTSLMGAVILSVACVWGLDAGQLTFWTAVSVLGALLAQAKGRHVLAGLLLACGTVKIATLVPFLLLFAHRRDWPSWLSFGLTTVLLCVLGSPLAKLPDYLRENLANIRWSTQAGHINDYSFAGPLSDDIISIDHWVYRLGLRDRAVVSAAQGSVLLALGVWILRLSRHRHTLISPGALYSITCLFGCLFLYHRVYDTIILGVPLFFCASKYYVTNGWRRLAYALIVPAVLMVMNMPRGEHLLLAVAKWSDGAGIVGYLVQALVLPYATWIVLAAMLLIRLAEQRTEHQSVGVGHA